MKNWFVIPAIALLAACGSPNSSAPKAGEKAVAIKVPEKSPDPPKVLTENQQALTQARTDAFGLCCEARAKRINEERAIWRKKSAADAEMHYADCVQVGAMQVPSCFAAKEIVDKSKKEKV